MGSFVDSDQFSHRQRGFVENTVNIALLALAAVTITARDPLITQQTHKAPQAAEYSSNIVLLTPQQVTAPFIANTDAQPSRSRVQTPDSAVNLVTRLTAPTLPFMSAQLDDQRRRVYREPDQPRNIVSGLAAPEVAAARGPLFTQQAKFRTQDADSGVNSVIRSAQTPTFPFVSAVDQVFPRSSKYRAPDVAGVFPPFIPVVTTKPFVAVADSDILRRTKYRAPDVAGVFPPLFPVVAPTSPFVSAIDTPHVQRKTYRAPDQSPNLLVTPYLGLYNPQDFGDWVQHKSRRVTDDWTPPNLALTQAGTPPSTGGVARVALTTQQRDQHSHDEGVIYNSLIYNVPPTPVVGEVTVWMRHRPGPRAR